MAILAKVAKLFYACDEDKHSERVVEVGHAVAQRTNWDGHLMASYATDIVAAAKALRAEVRSYLEVRNLPVESFAFEIAYSDINENGQFWTNFDLSNGCRYLVSTEDR